MESGISGFDIVVFFSSHIKFSVISRVEVWDVCKLVVVIKSKVGQGFVLSFYSFDLFEGRLIIPLGLTDF